MLYVCRKWLQKNIDELRGLHDLSIGTYILLVSNPSITYTDVRDPCERNPFHPPVLTRYCVENRIKYKYVEVTC